MKLKHCFVLLAAAMMAVCLSVVVNWQAERAVAAQNQPDRVESSVMSTQRQQSHEAVLTDATALYRVCSSRPQRILPAQGTRRVRTQALCFSFFRQHIVQPLHSFYDSRCRLESAPYSLSASCDYYVIALRHIIR